MYTSTVARESDKTNYIYMYTYTHVIHIYTCHTYMYICVIIFVIYTYMHLPGATLLNTTPEVVKPLAAIALELSKLSSYTGRHLAAQSQIYPFSCPKNF